jgi:ribonuclease Z
MSQRELIILGCSSQQPTRKRNHGAYLVRWDDEGWLFDPGEGTQRQFIHADVAPTCVNRIFISHFHGDHCWGLGSMFNRLNLDKIKHPIHCYYPVSGKAYFDRLRFGTIYHDKLTVIEHPVHHSGIVDEEATLRIEAFRLEHGVDNFAWRITEKDVRKFDPEKLKQKGIQGPMVRQLEKEGKMKVGQTVVTLDEVSYFRPGDVFAIAIDSLPCNAVFEAAKHATLFLCESTYLEEHRHLAKEYLHMTAKQAAQIAKEAGVKQLILTHFSARYQDLDGFAKEAREVFPATFIADDLKVFPFPRCSTS